MHDLVHDTLSARRLFATLGIVVCLACSDDTVGPTPAALEELCGETEPFQLLAFDPARSIHGIWGSNSGDRLVFDISFGPPNAFPIIHDYEVWSTGQCGEDPIHLTAGLEIDMWSGFPEEYGLGPAICQAQTHDILILDPTGVAAPWPLFETSDCAWLERTPHGVVTLLGDNADQLVLQPWPSDPLAIQRAEQIVLLDGIQSFRVSDTEAFALTTDDELVVVGLEDLTVEVLASNVREFRDSGSGRYVLWQGLEITNEDPDYVEGPLHVLDRETGESRFLADASLSIAAGNVWALESLGWVYFRDIIDGEYVDRYVHVPDASSIELPNMEPEAVIDETHALLRELPWSFVIVDTTTGETSTLPGNFDQLLRAFSASEAGIYLELLNGEAWRIDYSGTWTLIAKHTAGRWLWLPDGRTVSPWHIDSRGMGRLMIEEPGTFAQTWVDQDVLQYSLSVHSEDQRLISYAVGDPERHGVWMARVPE
jgi:hypothetical protein